MGSCWACASSGAGSGGKRSLAIPSAPPIVALRVGSVAALLSAMRRRRLGASMLNVPVPVVDVVVPVGPGVRKSCVDTDVWVPEGMMGDAVAVDPLVALLMRMAISRPPGAKYFLIKVFKPDLFLSSSDISP